MVAFFNVSLSMNSQKINSRVFLIGYPSCGKSSFGRRIASSLNMNFVDSDVLVSKFENKSIVDIFNDKGEEYFRNLEHSILLDYSNQHDNFIMATGGGLPCHSSNMDFINSVGVSFYLQTSVDTLLARLMNTKNIRPRFIGLSEMQMKEKIVSDLNERNKYYSKADYIIDTNCDVVRVIVQIISSYSSDMMRK